MIEFEKELPASPSNDELLERYRAITIERAAMRKLREHPGWKPYVAIVKGNARTIRQALNNMEAISSVEHALYINFEKGKAFALQMMIDLIEAVDSAYEMELQKLEVQIQERQDGQRTSDPGDFSASIPGDSVEPELPFSGTQPDQLAP